MASMPAITRAVSAVASVDGKSSNAGPIDRSKPPSSRRRCENSNTAAPDMRASWWVEVRLCAGWPKNGTYTLSPRLGSWSGAYHSNPPRLRWRAAPRTSCLANIAAA